MSSMPGNVPVVYQQWHPEVCVAVQAHQGIPTDGKVKTIASGQCIVVIPLSAAHAMGRRYQSPADPLLRAWGSPAVFAADQLS
jgi:hypothetical protein